MAGRAAQTTLEFELGWEDCGFWMYSCNITERQRYVWDHPRDSGFWYFVEYLGKAVLLVCYGKPSIVYDRSLVP